MTTSPVLSITEELLAELEQKAKAATPGPWRIYCDDVIENNEGEYVVDVLPSTDDDAAHIAAANPATILALVEHIRSLEARLAYIDRNFVGATFDYDGDGMAAMVVRISDRVSVCRDAMAVLDAAIAQEGKSHD